VNRRTTVLLGVVVGVIVLAALVAGSPSSRSGEPLSPQSTGPVGARATVLLVQELGGHVALSDAAPLESDDTALLLTDHLTDARRTAVDRWVRAGGTLVVTDEDSPFVPNLAGSNAFRPPDAVMRQGHCNIDALADAHTIEIGGALRFTPSRSAQSCFDDGEGPVVVATPHGAGTVVAIGSPEPFLNEALDQRDNSVLVASLLVPVEGTRFAFLEAVPGEGRTTLIDLVARRVKQALVQLGVAFVLYALWRARRLGRPITEPQPVQIAGSELVLAVGRLQESAHHRDAAAGVLRHDLRRSLAARLGLPPDAPAEVLADGAAARTGVDRDTVLAALSHRPLADDGQLVATADQIDAVRQEVLHGQRQPAG
jgi:hypothetical protein